MANKEMVIGSDFDIETKVYGLIMCIAHEMEAATARILKSYGLSNTQLSILDALDNSGEEVMTVNQIKGYMLDDNPNVSRSLNKLMENKLIVKERDLVDQRVVKIRITDEGRRVHREADVAITKVDNTSRLNEEEMKMLYDLLVKF